MYESALSDTIYRITPCYDPLVQMSTRTEFDGRQEQSASVRISAEKEKKFEKKISVMIELTLFH